MKPSPLDQAIADVRERAAAILDAIAGPVYDDRPILEEIAYA